MGKTAQKRRATRFEVEWITVSYRTLLLWVAVLLGLGVIVGGIYLGFQLEAGGEQRDVERLVAAVERDVRVARAANHGADIVPEIGIAEEHVRTARSALARRDLALARSSAQQAQDALRQLGGSKADEARMLQVEGQVEVKRVGSLEWSAAKVGLSLGPGDLVKTGANSAVQFVNLDGSTVTLGADTVLRIERSAKDRVSGKTDVAVTVDSGQLTMATAEMQPPGSTAEVKTGNASASLDANSVVGVGVDQNGDRSRIDVALGRARVQAGSSLIDVGPGERLVHSPEGLERRKLPGIPMLLSPPQYKLLLLRDLAARPLELEWESIRDARSYRVDLGQTPLFTKTYQQWDRHPTNYVAVERLPVGRYYWRVTAVDRDGVEGGPSPAGVFRVTDAAPEGEPPPLRVLPAQPLGEGMFLLEGKTQPGVFLAIDDGTRVVKAFQPGQSGEFKQVVMLQREGVQTITITARNSEGLERRVVQNVEVHFQ